MPATDRFFAEITASTDTLARLIDGADLTRPVPTCPDWTLRQLVTHLGRTQRWAAQITSTRSAKFIPLHSVPDGRLPDDPGQQAGWLRAGAARVLDAVRTAGDEPVWAFGELRPAWFWARRMAHETAVHRADGQIAAGQAPVIVADIAADGIDEWLTFVTVPGPGRPDQRLAGLADGQVLHLHATDDGLDGAGEWLISRDGDEMSVRPGHGKGDAAMRGPASQLLLVLTRRLPPQQPDVQVLGDPAVLTGWLAATPF